jgi:hypothetical protein
VVLGELGNFTLRGVDLWHCVGGLFGGFWGVSQLHLWGVDLGHCVGGLFGGFWGVSQFSFIGS